MMNFKKAETSIPDKGAFSAAALNRRKFFKYAGAGLSCLAITSAQASPPATLTSDAIDLGSGDFGILNYAYALEQLEAAFYTEVVDKLYHGATKMERQFLTDIRNDEISHREWFREVLSAHKIPDLKLAFDFSSVNFYSRESVLHTARILEDTGVSAFNGAGNLITVPDFLLLAGKIVSVEARHAAFIRDLISYGSYASDDVINNMGMDQAYPPHIILERTTKFFKSKINGSNLPTN